MIPVSLSLKNFGSFTAPQVFHFPQKPGLYFMCGDNQAEPRLEGNAAGKSTVWKALTWLFFEKTGAGLRAGGIANWGVGKNTEVILTFRDSAGDLPQFVTRTWSPNSWKSQDLFGNTHDLTKGNTNPILAALKLDFASFLQCVVMPQDTDLFLELKGDKQAELFSEVMGLDKWLRSSQKAADRARQEDMECRRLEREASNALGRVQALAGVNYAAQINEWETDRIRRSNAALESYEILLAQSKALKVELEKAIGLAERTRNGYRKQMEQSDVGQDGIASIRDALQKANNAVSSVGALFDDVQDRLDGLDGKAVCPLCEQGVDGVHGPKEHLHTKSKKLQDDLNAKALTVKALKANLETEEQRVSAQAAVLKRLLGDVDTAEQSVRQLRRSLEQAEKDLDRIEDEVERIEAEMNPYSSLANDHEGERRRLSADADRLKNLLDDAMLRFSLASAWVRWFKEIRLTQIGDALEQLEIEVNNQLTAVGLVDWELRFAVDKETKAGTISRGFSVTVLSPNNTGPVAWESWSGGERQRLVDAAQMGFVNLIRARTGADFGIEVWDEPTKGMSPQGVQDLLEALHARAHKEQRQIWIVDHRTLGFNKFAGTAKVVKTEAGSSFDLSGLVGV